MSAAVAIPLGIAHTEVREAWILAGTLDGVAASPALHADLGGIPYLTRLICDAAMAGATRVHVIWNGERPLPDIAAIVADPRVASRATVKLVATAPDGPADHPVLVLRADRVYHRDVPKLATQTWRSSTGDGARVRGYDAAIVTRRRAALRLVEATTTAGGLAAEIAALGQIAEADPPYMGFCVEARDRRGMRAAERTLVHSLRKAADGVAAKLLNRRISLPLTRILAATSIHPNHVTLIALVCALAGGAVISSGGYLAGLIGMLFVELGSIVDGIDGELARLRFQFSRRGQWLDTIVDDLANIAYATGAIISLNSAGVTWAVPVGVAAIGAFALTQGTQYWLILRVYRSGDLAAIPWAFQSTEFLSQRPDGAIAWIVATGPKLLKRDFVVTLFTVFAAFGRLDFVLVGFAAGAFVFFGVLFTQLVRNRASIGAARRRM